MTTETENKTNSTCEIYCKKFTIALELETNRGISSFLTATIRGGFGITLRRLVCPTIDLQCSECLLRNSCVYCYVFETVPSADSPRLKNYRSLPHPFTLWCRQNENVVSIELLLIGKAIRYLPYFIYTLRKLGSQGLGKDRLRYRIESVKTDDRIVYTSESDAVSEDFSPDILKFGNGPEQQGSVMLDFYTPMLLRSNGKFVHGFELYPFLSTLLRRVTSVYTIHCDGQNLDDGRAILDRWMSTLNASDCMTLEKNRRYSTRQGRKIDYDGFTGSVRLTGDIGSVMSYLRAGEILAVGKNTAFGFGRYNVSNLLVN